MKYNLSWKKIFGMVVLVWVVALVVVFIKPVWAVPSGGFGQPQKSPVAILCTPCKLLEKCNLCGAASECLYCPPGYMEAFGMVRGFKGPQVVCYPPKIKQGSANGSMRCLGKANAMPLPCAGGVAVLDLGFNTGCK